MLVFQGIDFINNKIENYRIEYKLQFSYLYAQELLLYSKNNVPLAIQKIKEEVDKIYKKKTFNSSDNLAIAVRMRTKDILSFFAKNDEYFDFLVQSLAILSRRISIPRKWKDICDLFYKESIKSELLQLDKNKNFIENFLLYIQLYFLDQIPEKPPFNSKLYFVIGDFPKYNWAVTDFSEKLKSKEWLPKEKLCRLNFLRASLWKFYYEKRNLFVRDDYFFQKQDKFKSIQLAYQKKEEKGQLLESYPDEVLRIFIQDILKHYRNKKGINHLVAILYQIKKKYKNNTCLFDWQEHFDLVLKYKTTKNFAEQVKIAQNIFDKLKNLRVIRVFQQENDLEVENPLIIVRKSIYSP